MASYRYLRDIRPEDLKPEAERALTPREKWANWWHYNAKLVLVFAAVAAGVIYFCYDVFWNKPPQPDYQVAVVGGTLTDNQIESLQERLAAVAEDINGDGQVLVQVNSYDVDYSKAGLAAEDVDVPGSSASSSAGSTVSSMPSMVDPYGQMAADVRLTADFQSASCGIFIVRDPEGFERITSAFRYLDGTPSDTDEDGYGPADWYNMVYRVSDCPVLAQALSAQLGPKTENELDIGEVLTQQYYVGFRSAFDQKTMDALADDDAFWAVLTKGAVSTAAKDAAQ
jgi:hypothetical protein